MLWYILVTERKKQGRQRSPVKYKAVGGEEEIEKEIQDATDSMRRKIERKGYLTRLTEI